MNTCMPIENVHNRAVAEKCAQKIAGLCAGFLHSGHAKAKRTKAKHSDPAHFLKVIRIRR